MIRPLQFKKALGLCTCALFVGVLACGGPQGEPSTGTVNGRVDSAGALPLEGAAITAYEVQADGSLTAISSGNVESAADGTYSVVVELTSQTMSDIVIVADDNGAQGSVIVSGELSAGSTLTAAPIDTETTVETDIYVEARAQGSWETGSSNTAQLRAWITAELAAAIHGSTDYASNVASCARATTSAMASWSGALAHSAVGATSSEIEAAIAAQTQAQAALDAQLHAATSQAEVDAAIEAYFDATVEAHSNAGITLEQMSNAAQAAAEAMLVYSGELTADAYAAAVSDAEQMRAALVRTAVEARFQAMAAASGVQQSVQQAGATLQTELEATASAGANAAADAQTAWGNYQASIEAELQAHIQAAAQSALAQVENTIDTAQASLSSALSSISASASVDVVAQATVDAFGVFYLSAFAQTNTTTLVTAGLSQADAEAVIQVLVSVSASAA